MENIENEFIITFSSQSDTLHNIANISYTGILSGDLGVHIGVYQPQSITPFQKF